MLPKSVENVENGVRLDPFQQNSPTVRWIGQCTLLFPIHQSFPAGLIGKRICSALSFYRLYYSGYRLYPNTFHNTINKNVNHSNDTIDNLNQSSFHKPARQCQGHLRT